MPAGSPASGLAQVGECRLLTALLTTSHCQGQGCCVVESGKGGTASLLSAPGVTQGTCLSLDGCDASFASPWKSHMVANHLL